METTIGVPFVPQPPRRYHIYFWNAALFKDTGMIFCDTWKEMVLNDFVREHNFLGIIVKL